MGLYDKYRETDYLDDISLIAGSEITLRFPVYKNGVAVTLGVTSEMVWVLGLYGQPDATPVLQKNATIETVNGNVFKVVLTEADTASLGSDIYLQQMRIKDASGRYLRPAQGVVIIRKAIPIS